MIDLTPILQALVGIIATALTVTVIPYIKSKYKNEKLADTVEKSVKAAQQLAQTFNWTGEQKKEYVISCLEAKGYVVDVDNVTDAINALIEAAVYELKK